MYDVIRNTQIRNKHKQRQLLQPSLTTFSRVSRIYKTCLVVFFFCIYSLFNLSLTPNKTLCVSAH